MLLTLHPRWQSVTRSLVSVLPVQGEPVGKQITVLSISSSGETSRPGSPVKSIQEPDVWADVSLMVDGAGNMGPVLHAFATGLRTSVS